MASHHPSIFTLPETNSKFTPENRPFHAPKGSRIIDSNHPSFRCKLAGFVSGRLVHELYVGSWNLKHLFINGCFNWMIPNHYIKNGCFTKHPLEIGCLGYQVEPTSRHPGITVWGVNKTHPIRSEVQIHCPSPQSGGSVGRWPNQRTT